MRMGAYWKENRAKVEAEKADKIERVGQLTILREETANGKPCVRIWRGAQGKPFANYLFKSAEGREEYIQRQIASDAEYAKTRQKWSAQRRATELMAFATTKLGDILYRTWGYDQTNVDFYQVVRKTVSRLVIRKIGNSTTETGFMCGMTAPVRDSFKGAEMVVKAGQYWAWEGKPVACSWYA